MLKKSILTALSTLALVAACTKSSDTGQRNTSVPAGSENMNADVHRQESGMTGSTTSSNISDPNPQHSQKREAVHVGNESHKGAGSPTSDDKNHK